MGRSLGIWLPSRCSLKNIEKCLKIIYIFFIYIRWDLSQGEKLSDKLNELTEASILGVFGTYPKQIDFFLLHGLTGNHAVRIIFHYLPEALQRQILKVNLLGFLTDYVIQGYPKVDINFITGDT